MNNTKKEAIINETYEIVDGFDCTAKRLGIIEHNKEWLEEAINNFSCWDGETVKADDFNGGLDGFLALVDFVAYAIREMQEADVLFK